jgi:DNA-directed RNA polymerase subunit RPC12/RpoP
MSVKMEKDGKIYCETCKKEMQLLVALKPGSDGKLLVKCPGCELVVEVVPKCSICGQTIEDKMDNVIAEGFRENSKFVHVSCLFIPENRDSFVAFRLYQQEKKGEPFCSIDEGRKKELMTYAKVFGVIFESWAEGCRYAAERQLRKNAERRIKK